MAAGNTVTGSLADSIDTVLDSARIVREYEGTFMRTTDVVTLKENSGLSWEEASLAQFQAQAVTETTVMDNPQQFSDTLLTVTPTVVGIQTIVTDRVFRRISKQTIAKMGVLAQNAMQRKKNADYLTVIDGATTSLAGSGTTWTSGHIAAAVNRIQGNTTESGMGFQIFTVAHPFQIKDIQDEVVAGVGTYTIQNGLTEETFRKGFKGTVADSNLFADGNISIDGTPDAKAGTHAREAIILVEGHSPRKEMKRRPEIGGGADEMFMYDEYALGERSAGNWLFEHQTDAAAPTS